MITYCIRKVKSWGEEGWAICQVLGPATTDYVLITNDETRPKYGLFTDKKQADGMLSWLEHEQPAWREVNALPAKRGCKELTGSRKAGKVRGLRALMEQE